MSVVIQSYVENVINMVGRLMIARPYQSAQRYDRTF